eukprot:TRINITY_DN23610_c0_g1_i2.p1 TRINITY_DN23610_c0_g1~~TRINITY_DN23610_c0_g1_i2.p1  ORF type:complete len:771 (+),score=106.39 TRINITY_DN23610_c0_g1_i2:213-2315(+)
MPVWSSGGAGHFAKAPARTPAATWTGPETGAQVAPPTYTGSYQSVPNSMFPLSRELHRELSCRSPTPEVLGGLMLRSEPPLPSRSPTPHFNKIDHPVDVGFGGMHDFSIGPSVKRLEHFIAERCEHFDGCFSAQKEILEQILALASRPVEHSVKVAPGCILRSVDAPANNGVCVVNSTPTETPPPQIAPNAESSSEEEDGTDSNDSGISSLESERESQVGGKETLRRLSLVVPVGLRSAIGVEQARPTIARAKTTEMKLDEEVKRHLSIAQSSKKCHKPKGRSQGDDELQKQNEVWVDGEGKLSRWARAYASLVKGAYFDYFIGIFIVLNTLFLGRQVDVEVRSTLGAVSKEQPYNAAVETFFAVLFTVELLMRLSVYRLRFFCCLWNLFDVLVVACAVVEECIKYGVGANTVLGKLKVFRLMRVFKLARAMKIIRVLRAFRELRIVMRSIFSCFRSLFWTLLLLTLVMYVVSIIIMDELAMAKDQGSYDSSTENGHFNIVHFGGLDRSILTLYQCVTGGLLWSNTLRAVEEVVPWIWVAWVWYVGFVGYAIANTVTGIFVDQAMKTAQEDARNMMAEEEGRRRSMMAELRQMLYKCDSNGDGVVSAEKMRKLCRTRQLRQLFRSFDVDPTDVLAYFDLVCSVNQTLPISEVDSFSRGLFRLKGFAKNLDVVALTWRQKLLHKEFKAKEAIMNDILVKLS